ncbi:hypothetical protein H5410_018901 [Solanum commersonii]|uniref:Uncharacterized protein n=1 Tax=Solanum commersonii TaxID=4109 RepID=A0A9J6A3D6_SOLCO|nr:hypothetical protein H5410_018901 [Solanum commersonii]
METLLAESVQNSLGHFMYHNAIFIMAQSCYLFALSYFQMDLLTEAETTLCPPNEPTAEVESVENNL